MLRVDDVEGEAARDPREPSREGQRERESRIGRCRHRRIAEDPGGIGEGRGRGRSEDPDVVAEGPSVVLRLSKGSIERMEDDDPELATALHRWLAGVLSERLSDTLREFDALLD